MIKLNDVEIKLDKYPDGTFFTDVYKTTYGKNSNRTSSFDVNQLVEYTSHESGETHQYIIKSITTDYNETGTQTIVMSRYYPLYPDI